MKKNFDTLVLYVILFLSIATFVSVLFGCAFRKGKEHFSNSPESPETIKLKEWLNKNKTNPLIVQYNRKKKIKEQIIKEVDQDIYNKFKEKVYEKING